MERTPATGGLQAPTSLGIAMSELEAILAKFDTQSTVEDDLKHMGLTEEKKPEFELPEITAEALTTTDNTQYTTMYAQQLAWFNYLSPILAKVCAGLLQSENQMVLIEARIEKRCKDQNKLRSKEERLKDADIKVEVLNDPIYQEAMLEAQRLKQYKLRLEAMTEIAGRNLRVISRQVEMKKIEIEGHNRENGIGRPWQPRPVGGGGR